MIGNFIPFVLEDGSIINLAKVTEIIKTVPDIEARYLIFYNNERSDKTLSEKDYKKLKAMIG